MKMGKLIPLALTVIGLASIAVATPVQCSVLMNPNTSGNSSSLCTITAPGGFYISSLTLTATDDYTGYQTGNPSVTYSGTLTPSATLTTPFSAPTFCTVTTSGTNSVPCNVLPSPNNASNTDTTITTFTLQLTGAGNSVSGGTITGDSIVLNLDYGVTMIPTTGTPEPATLGLTGGALLGLAFLASKLRKA